MYKIAPHENNEVDLVVACKKPFAIIEYKKDPSQFMYAFTKAKELDIRNTDEPNEIAIERKGHGAHHYNLYLNLTRNRTHILRAFGKAFYQRKMGKIFGYSDDEIEEFINNPPDCTCGKCGG